MEYYIQSPSLYSGTFHYTECIFEDVTIFRTTWLRLAVYISIRSCGMLVYFAILALVLGLFSYYAYINWIIKKTVSPHSFSWFVWWFASSAVAYIQYESGAGYWALNMVFVALLCFWISIFSWRHWIKPSKTDIVCLIFGILAVIAYLFEKNSTAAVILLIVADVLWFIPTFLKSWHFPWWESASSYAYASAGYISSLWAMSVLNFATSGFVIETALFNGALAYMLYYRRKSVVEVTI